MKVTNAPHQRRLRRALLKINAALTTSAPAGGNTVAMMDAYEWAGLAIKIINIMEMTHCEIQVHGEHLSGGQWFQSG